MLNETEKSLVKALRSGVYRQAQEKLRDGNRFCCLGVLCDITGLGIWVPDEAWSFTTEGGELERWILPDSVREHIGWSAPEGILSVRDRVGKFTTLASLNDEGLTFDQIADVIEAGLVRREEN